MNIFLLALTIKRRTRSMAVSDNQKLNNNAYVIKLQPEMAIFSTFNIIADL